ncbi:MAG: TetR/AcrR family transcriptional regulator [Proteobacteria bacterium]|nr:TetR/AcrR family transcriptional regulator [Pseudomonadota bacterium]
MKCFAEQGCERVTYDDLIARSKVSRGSFYWYFPSKEALYDAVLDYCVSGYVARVEAQFEKTSSKGPIVKRLLDAVLADFNANRSQYRVLLRPPPSKGAIAKLAQWNDDALAFMASKLAPLVKAGKLDAEPRASCPTFSAPFSTASACGSCSKTRLRSPRSHATSKNSSAGSCQWFSADSE